MDSRNVMRAHQIGINGIHIICVKAVTLDEILAHGIRYFYKYQT